MSIASSRRRCFLHWLLLACTVSMMMMIAACGENPVVRTATITNIKFKGKVYYYIWRKYKNGDTSVEIRHYSDPIHWEPVNNKKLQDEIEAIAQSELSGRHTGYVAQLRHGKSSALNPHAQSNPSYDVYILDKVFLYQFDADASEVTKRLNLSVPPFTGFPVGLQITTDGKTGVVTNSPGSSGGPYVLLIDLATFAATATIALPDGNILTSLAITPDNKLAYVLGASKSTGACSVYVIDLAAQKVQTTIALAQNDEDMNVIGITPDGTEAYVASSVVNDMFSIPVIDIATNTISTRISMQYYSKETGLLPFTPGSYLAVHPDGSRVYLAPIDGSPVRVIDTATKTITKLINIPQGAAPWFGTGPTFSQNGQILFVLNAPNGISMIDTTTDTLANTIDLDSDLVGQAPGSVRVGFFFIPD